MADKFDEFLEEVESDIRREKFASLWQRYGKLVIVSIVGALCLSGSYMLWQKHQHYQSQGLSEQFIKAQDLIAQGKFDEALEAIKPLANSSYTCYSVLAQFSEAYLIAKTNYQQGIKVYHHILSHSKADKTLKGLAALFISYLKADHLPLETAALSRETAFSQIDSLIQEVEPLTAADQPWHPLALELMGALLYKKQDFGKATEVFLKLVQNPQTPRTIQSRARLMLQNLSTRTPS